MSKLTGGSSEYYQLKIRGQVIECNDIIKALKLNYALGNILKAVWRIGMSHMGRGKEGTTRIYDAEKIVFFGKDQLDVEKEAEFGQQTKPDERRSWERFIPATPGVRQKEEES